VVISSVNDLVEMSAVVLLVRLGEADEAADGAAVIAVELEQLILVLAAAAGNALMRSRLVTRRHHFMVSRRRLTPVIPRNHTAITNGDDSH